MIKDRPLGFEPDARYRYIPEWRILNMLLLAGWAYEINSPEACDYTQRKINEWMSQGLPFVEGPDGERFFDAIEVGNYAKLAGFEGRDDFLSEHFVPNHRRMVEDLAAYASNGECRMTVEFKRVFSLEGMESGTKLRLRAPRPLDGKYLKYLEVTPWVQAAAQPEVMQGPGKMETKLTTSGEPAAILGARWDFAVTTQEGDGCDEPDRELYLKEQEGLIVVTPTIRELARKLAANGAPAHAAIREFWEYLNREMIFGAMHYDQIDLSRPCDWILEHGWFDCQLGSSVLSALCRASGIPARMVSGYLLYHRAPLKHYWMEAWLEESGWTPFDLISWDISEGGRDLAWRDRFFGKVDYRLVVERMPREFTGALGVPLPAEWNLLQQPIDNGVKGLFCSGGGKTIYTDLVRILT